MDILKVYTDATFYHEKGSFGATIMKTKFNVKGERKLTHNIIWGKYRAKDIFHSELIGVKRTLLYLDKKYNLKNYKVNFATDNRTVFVALVNHIGKAYSHNNSKAVLDDIFFTRDLLQRLKTVYLRWIPSKSHVGNYISDRVAYMAMRGYYIDKNEIIEKFYDEYSKECQTI